jgi:hypothetical protein
MILQLRQMRRTDARTFMMDPLVPFYFALKTIRARDKS